jgi:transposase
MARKVVFKPDQQNQPNLFPFTFDEYVAKDHPVRVINKIINEIDLSDILDTYKGGGASSFHPRIMLKIIIYAYLNNTYSSRKIEKLNQENVQFLWLNGQNFPDHNTINNFRSSRLKGKIDDIFKQIVVLLNQRGIISFEKVFTDGTKIESVANRYTFVWRKSVERYKARLEGKIKDVIDQIEKAIDEDAKDPEKQDQESCSEITSDELRADIERLNQKLQEKGASKQQTQKIRQLEKKSLPKLIEYETHLSKLGNRNSYSKTDNDATFFRMKEDKMGNGELKPAYNLQLSTENSFITNYSIHQNAGDTATFKEHLNRYKEKYGQYPKAAITDAGYGSLENYRFLDAENIGNYLKYNTFYKENTKKFRAEIGKVENLYYNEEHDFFVCPMGQKMVPVGYEKRVTQLGEEYWSTRYKAQDCSRCPLRGPCHKQKGNRSLLVSKEVLKYRWQARENLRSETGKKLRKQRSAEVEQAFGQIKWNKGFKRFLLKGIDKVNIEIGLLAIAHNLQKLGTLVAKTGDTMLFLEKLLSFCQKIGRLMHYDPKFLVINKEPFLTKGKMKIIKQEKKAA